MPFDPPLLLKRYWYPLAASALIACGVAVRLTLILIGWPHLNSEEGTMGLEAMHILLRGEHPIYFYGQHYMGAGEAYAGALAFRVFGISTVSLRLGMIAFYAIFMVGVFWLAHLLYSRRVALVSLAALILGPQFLVGIELRADGGKAETMACGATIFALASWLALSQSHRQISRGQRVLRYAAFVAWGTAAGFGLYTYAIIAPFVLTSGLLLWITCRRELRGWTVVLPLSGLLLGLLPAIIYTATMPFADNPIAVFLSLHQSLNAGRSSNWYLLARQIDGTLLYTLPAVTGLLNLYPLQALPLYGPLSRSTLTSVIIGGGWSLVYLSLLGVATYRPAAALLQGRKLRQVATLPEEEAQTDVTARIAATSPLAAQVATRDVARLMLSLTAWLTIAGYMFSSTAANNPHSGRYMIGLLVVVPALLWPLVDQTPPIKDVKSGSVTRTTGIIPRNAWRLVGVALLGASLILGAIDTTQAVPTAVAANRSDATFAHDLLSRGITRFYSDYWTCDLLNFDTRERLTCAVVGEYAQPGLTRYLPYFAAVQADRDAPYVLIQDSPIERTFMIHAVESHQRYVVEYLDGYAVYTPAST